MIDTAALRKSICAAFRGELAVKELPSGVAITTIFRDSVSDPISCFIEQNDEGWYMTDDGHFLSDTIARGIDLNGGSRKDFLDRILAPVRARCDLHAMEIRTQTMAAIPQSDDILQFIVALTRVRDVAFWSRERIKSTFKDDAYRALQDRFVERAEIFRSSPVDNSMQEFPADVVIRPQQTKIHLPTTAVFFVQVLDTMNEALMLWMEARDQRRSDIRVTALIEDGSVNLSSFKAQRAFNRIDTTAIFRGDETAAIDRIERVALLAAA
ncbi:MAG: DUF1828 domain-containing protein [Acetobacteraceae bacterium]|nr:DUF1828 domain-containing protein [Acetobacteraceae bacterium]